MNLNAVADALAALADNVVGIENTSGYVPDVVIPPHFYVAEIGILWAGDPANTFGGKEAATILCRTMVSHAPDEDEQRLLRTFMRRTGPTSIKAALEGTPGVAQSLGGLCDDLFVPRMQGHRMYTVGTNKYYGAEWVVKVIGSPDAD